jgi:hypothetical protein
MSSEIDLRPNPFDKGGLNNPEFQVNSAERRSKFELSLLVGVLLFQLIDQYDHH